MESHADELNQRMDVLEVLDSKSGFVVVPIHYSHDNAKTPGDMASLRQTYDRDEDWDREMEMDFTAQLGIAAYPSFNEKIHVRSGLIYRKNAPLLLACDFNVDPCVFEVCQTRSGKLFVIDEICLSPGNIPDMITEFRNRYPDHPAEVHVYGDSNGLRRTSQTEKSDYELMQIHMQGYPSRFVIKVPRSSPPSRARINSLNNRLKGYDNIQCVYVSDQCVELIADFHQVVLRPDGNDVLKVYREGNPYARRTHASDALGYLIHREWPISREAAKLKSKNKPRAPISYGKLLGEM